IPAAVFTRPGADATATVTIAGNPGFSGTVNLSLGAFPNGSNLTGSFSPGSIAGSGTAILTIHSTAQTPAGYDPVDIVATASDGSGEREFPFETFVDNAAPASDIVPVFLGYSLSEQFYFGVSDIQPLDHAWTLRDLQLYADLAQRVLGNFALQRRYATANQRRHRDRLGGRNVSDRGV